MARYERNFNMPIFTVARKVEDAVMQGSISASLEESSDFAFTALAARSGYLNDTAGWGATGSA